MSKTIKQGTKANMKGELKKEKIIYAVVKQIS